MQKAERDPMKYPSRFGIAAVKLGYISPGQLREAMREQLDINIETGVHRLIGEILHEKGWMNVEQVRSTLAKME